MENDYVNAILHEAIKGYETCVYVDEYLHEINFRKHSPVLLQYLKAYSTVPMINLVRYANITEEWSNRYYYFDENDIVHLKYVSLKPKSTEELLTSLRDCIAYNVEKYKIVLERIIEYGKALMVKQLEDI